MGGGNTRQQRRATHQAFLNWYAPSCCRERKKAHTESSRTPKSRLSMVPCCCQCLAICERWATVPLPTASRTAFNG